jgi:DNA gyrase subunit B
MSNVFGIPIRQRFKGLGELPASLMFTTTINPKFRKLIKLTIKKVEDALSTFELIHGKTSEMRESRRELLRNTRITYADIDN